LPMTVQTNKCTESQINRRFTHRRTFTDGTDVRGSMAVSSQLSHKPRAHLFFFAQKPPKKRLVQGHYGTGRSVSRQLTGSKTVPSCTPKAPTTVYWFAPAYSNARLACLASKWSG